MHTINIEEKIQNLIVSDIFKLFTNGEFQEARELLEKTYIENYEDLTDFSVKRLLVHNLAWAENKLGDASSAKIHIKAIKEEIENDIDYVNNNMEDYCLILNLYCGLFKDEIEFDEYREINIFIANYHHESGNVGREYIALGNIYLAEKRWDDVVLLIEKLKEHNEDDYFAEAISEQLEKCKADANMKDHKNGGEINV